MSNERTPFSLVDLKHAVDATIAYSDGLISPDDIPVLVTTADPSMGPRAAASITDARMGFDWENNQFRIATDRQLMNLGSALQDAKPVVCRPYDCRNYYWCPRCDGKVSKGDKYCRHCGQKMK